MHNSEFTFICWKLSVLCSLISVVKSGQLGLEKEFARAWNSKK